MHARNVPQQQQQQQQQQQRRQTVSAISPTMRRAEESGGRIAVRNRRRAPLARGETRKGGRGGRPFIRTSYALLISAGKNPWVKWRGSIMTRFNCTSPRYHSEWRRRNLARASYINAISAHYLAWFLARFLSRVAAIAMSARLASTCSYTRSAARPEEVAQISEMLRRVEKGRSATFRLWTSRGDSTPVARRRMRERFHFRSLSRKSFLVFPRPGIVRRATMKNRKGESPRATPGRDFHASRRDAAAGADAGHRASFATAALSLRDAPLLLLA